MNKESLVTKAAEKAEMTKKDTVKVVDAVIEAITEALENGEDVNLAGFGKFSVRERAARTGYNPKLLAELKAQGVDEETAKKQAEVPIDASKKPTFKPAKNLKEALK